jgi:hypothetical protein
VAASTQNFVSAADHVKDIKESILDTEQSLAKAVAASPQNQEEIKEWQESLGISHGELARWEAKMQVQELIDLCTKRLSQLEKKIQSAEAENPTEAEELEKIATYKLRIPMWQQYLASHQSKLGIHVRLTPAGPHALRTGVAQSNAGVRRVLMVCKRRGGARRSSPRPRPRRRCRRRRRCRLPSLLRRLHHRFTLMLRRPRPLLLLLLLLLLLHLLLLHLLLLLLLLLHLLLLLLLLHLLLLHLLLLRRRRRRR